ncbi:MAG: septum formation initiator family protein [Candidatus Pacebacteria bacterium]|nr:septum formation initiator family protein [Candidatus Paceibacterota bacterium]
MFDFYEKRKIRYWLYSWPSVVLLIIIAGLLTHGVWGVYQQARQTRINKNQQLAHLEGLEAREQAIQSEIDRLNTTRGVEAEIRQKYEVAKEGEQVIVIVDTPRSMGDENGGERGGFWDVLVDILLFWR